MYNLRTKDSDTWSGVKGEVTPDCLVLVGSYVPYLETDTLLMNSIWGAGVQLNGRFVRT